MFQLFGANKRIHRRSFLQAGFLGMAGLGLGELLRCRNRARAGSASPERRSCILLWLGGGPSHLDTYDLKPRAPIEIRGPYQPIATRVPGMHVCELLPRHAQTAHRYTLIRSCMHDFPCHFGGIQHVLTGYPAVLTGGGTRTSVYPEAGTVFKRVRGQSPDGPPSYVALDHRLEGVGPAYLGASYEPFIVPGNPNDPGYRVPNLSLPVEQMSLLQTRRALRGAFDCLRRDLDQSGVMRAMDSHDQEAMRLLASRDTERAFDLGQEELRVRERYGRTTSGQSFLLARRLVEAGVGFVTVEAAYYAGVDGGWDDHAGVCNIFERMDRRLPVYDKALTALIDDIYDRGLDQNVLILALGEFGRTPLINTVDGKPGREHWPWAMSILVSGGGMRMGQVIGSTDSRGERPTNRLLRPPDLLATLYRFLGIDPRLEFRDHTGRPRPILTDGQPIRELQ